MSLLATKLVLITWINRSCLALKMVDTFKNLELLWKFRISGCSTKYSGWLGVSLKAVFDFFFASKMHEISEE